MFDICASYNALAIGDGGTSHSGYGFQSQSHTSRIIVADYPTITLAPTGTAQDHTNRRRPVRDFHL